MQSKALLLGLVTALLLVVPSSLVACSSSSPSPPLAGSRTPSASPTPGVGGAPSRAAIVAAVKRLVRQRHMDRPWAISVLELGVDASGRWRASTRLTGQPTSSYLGDVMVIVKDAGGWHCVVPRRSQPDWLEPTLPWPWTPGPLAQAR